MSALLKKCLRDRILIGLQSVEKIGGSIEGIGKAHIYFREGQIDERELVRRTFAFLNKFAIEKDIRIVIMFDEFQKISDLDEYIFKILKKQMDESKSVKFVFSGSSLSMLQDLFL